MHSHAIIYGNPTFEQTPVVTYTESGGITYAPGRDTVNGVSTPSGYTYNGKLVNLTAHLTRLVTTSEEFAEAFIQSALALSVYDELAVNGTSYGRGWALKDSGTVPDSNGWVQVRLEYAKENVSPIDFARPAGLLVVYAENGATIKWNGVTAYTFAAEGARRGFRLVDGSAGGTIVRSGHWSYDDYETEGAKFAFTLAHAFSGYSAQSYVLLLGDGTPVASAVRGLKMVRFDNQSQRASWEKPNRTYYVYSNSPPPYGVWDVAGGQGQVYNTQAQALAAGNEYYKTVWLPKVQACADEMAGFLAAGYAVDGFTECETVSGNYNPSQLGWVVVKQYGLGGKYGFVCRTPVSGWRIAENDGVQYAGAARGGWRVEGDTATMTAGGLDLLAFPPDGSDSGSA